MQWFKSQKRNKPVRILPPPSSNNLSGSQATSSQSQSSKSENLGDLKVAVSGLPKESLVWHIFYSLVKLFVKYCCSRLTNFDHFILGLILQKEWKGKIEAAGGQLHAKIKKGICSMVLFLN